MRAYCAIRQKLHIVFGLAGAAAIGLALLISAAPRAKAQTGGSPLHPTFPLLDAAGEHVLTTGQPVSTMTTCGACHDTEFIAGHSFHADVGLSSDDQAGFQPWDTSPGLFGRWDPLNYRYLSPEGDERIDLTTAAWIQVFGQYHVGGGPAVTSRSGGALTDPAGDAPLVETHILDPDSGELVPWGWEESGVVEMNCFLCHLDAPNNAARVAALEAGQFAWANTATLAGTGIVEPGDDGTWRWNAAAFSAEGELAQEYVTIPGSGRRQLRAVSRPGPYGQPDAPAPGRM